MTNDVVAALWSAAPVPADRLLDVTTAAGWSWRATGRSTATLWDDLGEQFDCATVEEVAAELGDGAGLALWRGDDNLFVSVDPGSPVREDGGALTLSAGRFVGPNASDRADALVRLWCRVAATFDLTVGFLTDQWAIDTTYPGGPRPQQQTAFFRRWAEGRVGGITAAVWDPGRFELQPSAGIRLATAPFSCQLYVPDRWELPMEQLLRAALAR